MGTVTDTIEGIVFTAGVNKDYPTDQLNLNKYVPSRLDRYVDGVLSNDRSTFTDIDESNIVAEQRKHDTSVQSLLALTKKQASIRRENLAANLVGFNSYELIYRYLLEDSYSYSNMLTYFNQCGANLVRIMYPCYSAAEYSSLVFANGIPSGEITDASFRQSFLTKSDAVFSAAANANVKLMPCLFWWTTAIADLFGETVISAINTNSQSYNFMIRFVKWFGKRYGSHPAFGAFSFFNEQQYDTAGTAHPTPTNIGNVNKGLVAAMREYTDAVATTDYNLFVLNTSLNRPTFVSEANNIRLIAQGCDALGVHIYGYGPSQSGMNFVGSFGVTTSALGPATNNKLGLEGLESFLTAMRSIAESMNVPMWITETGVPTDVDTTSTYLRRSKLLSVCQQYADVILLWNAADVATPQANQIVWQIRPNTTLGDTYKNLVIGINNSRSAKKIAGVGAGTTALRLRRQPKYCFSSTRSAGATVRVTATGSMTTSTQAFMCWIRKDAALNNFENLFDARGSGNTSGCIYLAGATATSDAEYAEFRGASGGVGNSAGRWSRMPDNEFYHIAFVYRTINGQVAIEMWLNGIFWGSYAATGTYAGIPNGTIIYSGGGSTNGAPISMQDVALMHYASPEDIWAHMDGAVLPQAYLHLRADNSTIIDLSRSNLAVTIGSGVTVGPA